jgi:hypothetical protein
LKRLSFLFAIAIAACSSGGPTPSVVPQEQYPAAGPNALPLAGVACPVVGKTYKRSNSTSTVAKEVTYPVFHSLLSWTVTFANQASMNPPVKYQPWLSTCGPDTGQKPFGIVRNLGITSIKSSCDNGVCTVTATYSVEYTPKKHLPGNKSWEYDVVHYSPDPAKKPYGPLPAFLIEVKRFAP